MSCLFYKNFISRHYKYNQDIGEMPNFEKWHY